MEMAAGRPLTESRMRGFLKIAQGQRQAEKEVMPDDEYETPQVKLKNALYGLKDSPKAWGHLMRRFLARQKILQRTEEAGIMAEFEHTIG